MKHLPVIGRYFFALGVLGIAIEHFIFHDFILGRAPAWPESLPGKLPWAYATGAFFILVSIAIVAKKHVRVATVIMAMLVFFWAFLRHLPVVAAGPFLSGAWTAAGKALVFIGGALAVAAAFPNVQTASDTLTTKFVNLNREFVVTARVCLGLFLVLTGVQHFLFTDFVASLIPGWFPGNAVFWTYFAGVALIAGGLGLLVPRTAPLAARLSGLMIFSWFWIVHIPRTAASASDNIAVFEALAFSGIAFAIMRSPAK